jgi:arylsulfatase A-like enzyme
VSRARAALQRARDRARAALDWTRALLGREPWRSIAITGLAAAGAACLAMIAAKVACILSVANTPLGRSQLGEDAGLLATPGWFAADLRAALLWGLLLAPLGALRGRRSRIAGDVSLVLLHVALAGGLLVCVTVYQLFGVPPTWQLLGALSEPGNASDSVASLFDTGRVLLLLVLLVCAPAAAWLLRALFRRRPRVARRTAAGLATATVLFWIAGALAGADRFELDSNPITTFFETGLFGQSLDSGGGTATPADLARVVEPVAGEPVAEHDPAAYQALARWARTGKRNVVLVVLETTAVRHMGVMGGPDDNTPTFSRLAEHGILWKRHYTHTPSSMFALYQVLGSNHGTPQGIQISGTRPRIDCRSLPEVLTGNGWRAGLFHSGRFSYSSKDLFLAGRGYDVMYDTQGMPNRERYQETSWGIEEQASIDAMMAWVKAAPQKPFFITYVPVYPHHPYPVPHKQYEKFSGRGVIGKYTNSVYYIDQMVDAMIRGLAELGVADNTLFIFVGDHGEGFGEHPGSQMHGSKLYDEAVHSFAMWYAPGALDHAAVDLRPTGHVDIAPTLLDLLGLPAQRTYVGTSVAVDGPLPMVPLYTGYGHPLVGFVDGRWKIIHNRRTGKSELYDLLADPDEQEPLQREQPDLVRTWRERAVKFVAAQKAWEASLPDLEGGVDPGLKGREEVWTADPATCTFPSSHFTVDGGGLKMLKPGEKTVTCEHPLPAEPAGITGLQATGHESINAAFITVMVTWRGPGGQRREVAYCTLNGSSKKPASTCRAKLVAGATSMDGGGKLVLELRFVTTDKNPTPDRFSVGSVEVKYRLRQ